jgi:flagellar biogenesis protein FliO
MEPWMLARALYALAVVGALLAALRFLLRGAARRGLNAGHADARFVRVVETAMLSHGAMLHVIRTGDAYHVVGVTQGSLTNVCEIPSEVAARIVASAAPGAPSRASVVSWRRLLRSR